MKEKGFPYILSDFDIYHYSIPSKGPREAAHFLWKQSKHDIDATPEQRKLISSIHDQEKWFYSRNTRREVKNKLLRLGVFSPRNAEFLLRDLLGDQSAPTNTSEKESLIRLDTYVNAGEDIGPKKIDLFPEDRLGEFFFQCTRPLL